MADTQIEIPLFRDDLTYEELHDIVVFMLAREFSRSTYGSDRLTSTTADDAVLKALTADNFAVRMTDPYSEYELKPLRLSMSLAPECVKERLRDIVWYYSQKLAKKGEDKLREGIARQAADAARRPPTQEEIEWDEGSYGPMFFG